MMCKSLLSVLFLMGLTGITSGFQANVCPNDWITHQRSLRTDCFKLYNTSHLAWDEAKASCANQNGTLLQMLDSDMASIVKNIYKEVGQLAWIGLQASQGDSSGHYADYKWTNGDKFSLNSPVWSQIQSVSKGAEKCVTLFLSHWQLITHRCNSKIIYICHRALLATLPTTRPTESRATTVTDTIDGGTSAAAGLSLNALLSLILATMTMVILQL